MIFHDVPQGHVDWFALRVGKVTASELDNLLTPEFKPRTGETPKKYLYLKAAELWRGKPLFSTGSWATEQGQLREEEAVPWLALERNVDIRPGGFISTDNGLAGCSPDGLISDNMGLEVKCPEPANAVKYLLEGILPKDYILQVYGSLYVTGFPSWTFLSYQRGFPAFIVEIERDEAIMEKIDKAVKDFSAKLKLAQERLAFMDKTPVTADHGPEVD